jgi:hypothetical protein
MEDLIEKMSKELSEQFSKEINEKIINSLMQMGNGLLYLE